MSTLTTRSQIKIHHLEPPTGEVDQGVGLLVAGTSYPHLQAEPLRPLEDQSHDLEEAQGLDFPLEPRPEYMTEQ